MRGRAALVRRRWALPGANHLHLNVGAIMWDFFRAHPLPAAVG